VLALAVLHAAGESSPGGLPPDTHGALLAVPDEAALLAQAERLRARDLELVEVREDTAPYCGQLMAIGVRPGPRKTLKPHFGGLPCLREVQMKA
jgi:hypothetical protein